VTTRLLPARHETTLTIDGADAERLRALALHGDVAVAGRMAPAAGELVARGREIRGPSRLRAAIVAIRPRAIAATRTPATPSTFSAPSCAEAAR
jgi:hypothetical protein